MTPSPSTQARREDETGVVDLTGDGLSETPRVARPRATASVAPVAPALPPVAPASEYPFPNSRVAIVTNQCVDIISLLDGRLQGSPAETVAKAIHKYRSKFRLLKDPSDKREGEEDTIVHERICSVVGKVEKAEDLATLIAIHKKHGQNALIAAYEMFVKEHKVFTKMIKQFQELPIRMNFRNGVFIPQTERVTNIEASIDFCDRLVTDIVALPLAVKRLKIKVKTEV